MGEYETLFDLRDSSPSWLGVEAAHPQGILAACVSLAEEGEVCFPVFAYHPSSSSPMYRVDLVDGGLVIRRAAAPLDKAA